MRRTNILCFGDSNTYGFIPDGSGRYDEDIRWTGLLQKRLGDKYNIIEEGLCGRTTVFHDELRSGRRGIDLIGTIMETHYPVDVLVVMLGTNDCKTRYGASAGTIAKGIEEVINKARKAPQKDPKVVLISPILLGNGVGEEGFDTEFDEKSEEVSEKLSEEYNKVAKKYGYTFLDASSVAKPSTTDREHLDENGHKALAVAVWQTLQELIS